MAEETESSTGAEEFAELAERLGFSSVRIIDREGRTSPLIHATWRGAPVALSLRTGIAGGFSCAFYRGPQPVVVDEDGEEWQEGEWDEVADSHFGGYDMALVLGAALLEEYSDGREVKYQGLGNEPLPQFRREATDDEVLNEALRDSGSLP